MLKAAQNQIMLVELKNGETYNGILVSCDTWMNINLREVVCTSRDGDRFWRMNECYVRGSMIKCMRMPDEVIEQVKEVQKPRQQNRTHDQRRDGKRPAPNHRQNNKPGGYKQQRTNNQRNQPVDGQ